MGERSKRAAVDERYIAIRDGLVPRPAIGNPVADTPTRDPDEVDRKTRCLYWRGCATYASAMEWKMFSCIECRDGVEFDQNSEMGRNDEQAIKMLLRRLCLLDVPRAIEPEDRMPTVAESRGIETPGITWKKFGAKS